MCGYVSEHEFQSVWHACVCVCVSVYVFQRNSVCKCEVVCVMSVYVCVFVHADVVERKGEAKGNLSGF